MEAVSGRLGIPELWASLFEMWSSVRKHVSLVRYHESFGVSSKQVAP